MSARTDKAVEYKLIGMNCAQAVALAFADLTDLDEETLSAMTQSFGVGIGATMEGTCGALIGANLMLGLIKGEDGRSANMKRGREMMNRFLEQNQSVTCKELKGAETGVVLRSCPDCVADAAGLLEEILDREETV